MQITDIEIASVARRLARLMPKATDPAWLTRAAAWLTQAGNLVRDERLAHTLHEQALLTRERAGRIDAPQCESTAHPVVRTTTQRKESS